MHLIRWAALAACLVAVSASTAAPFQAARTANARGAKTDSIDGYQQVSDKAKCELRGLCVLVYPEVEGTPVVIQHVSCTFGLKPGTKFDFAYLGNALGTKDGFNTLSAQKVATLDGDDFYTINVQTYLFIPVGQRAQASVVSEKGKAQNFNCTISGQRTEQPA